MAKHKLEAKTKEQAWNEVKQLKTEHTKIFKDGEDYFVMLIEHKDEEDDKDGRRESKTLRNRKRV